MSTERGFTISELLITLSIVGILATLAGPSFSDMLKNNRLTTQTNDLILAMNIARSEAVKRGNAVAVTWNGNWAMGWTVAVVQPAEVLRIGDPLDGATTMTNSLSNTVITYRSSGTAAGDTVTQPGIFLVCDDRPDETGRQIEITTTGRINVTLLAC